MCAIQFRDGQSNRKQLPDQLEALVVKLVSPWSGVPFRQRINRYIITCLTNLGQMCKVPGIWVWFVLNAFGQRYKHVPERSTRYEFRRNPRSHNWQVLLIFHTSRYYTKRYRQPLWQNGQQIFDFRSTLRAGSGDSQTFIFLDFCALVFEGCKTKFGRFVCHMTIRTKTHDWPFLIKTCFLCLGTFYHFPRIFWQLWPSLMHEIHIFKKSQSRFFVL